MLIRHNREKLINAIIFFSNETSHCNKIKLFKLLYHFDFEHFSLTGRPVTDLEYYAWPMGPVPKGLDGEIDNPPEDLKGKVRFEMITGKKGRKSLQISPEAEFDPTCFTKRELAILKDVAYRYAMDKADEMIESTHLPTQPWHRVYNEEQKKNQLIPYEYVLDKNPHKQELLESFKEYKEMLANYA
ncbi:MAG TPA: Panacea domain-containing protein [Blastocatellia bacterium]|nr:Panacea domain-containing protein [Blastocatellia bacterium]